MLLLIIILCQCQPARLLPRRVLASLRLICFVKSVQAVISSRLMLFLLFPKSLLLPRPASFSSSSLHLITIFLYARITAVYSSTSSTAGLSSSPEFSRFVIVCCYRPMARSASQQLLLAASQKSGQPRCCMLPRTTASLTPMPLPDDVVLL